MREIVILAMLAMIISIVFTPIVRKIAIRINAVDIPKERKIHKEPIPLLGGVVIYTAFIIGVLCKPGIVSKSELGIIIGATIIVLGGVIDDLKDLKPIYKLLFQIAAAVVLIIVGIEIKLITNPFSGIKEFLDLTYIGIPLTIIWVVGVTNAFNLIDGLDGLAAGLAFISSVTILIIAVMNNRYEAALLTGILSGALLGFLPYNYNPASIFMGDAGAQLLGFLLASISIQGTIKSATAFAVAVPILAFGLPLYDTLFAMIRRKMNGKPIMQADKGHLHHRLLSIGLTQKQAVLVMYLISIMLGSVAIIAMQISNRRAYFLMTVIILVIFSLAWKSGFFKNHDH